MGMPVQVGAQHLQLLEREVEVHPARNLPLSHDLVEPSVRDRRVVKRVDVSPGFFDERHVPREVRADAKAVDERRRVDQLGQAVPPTVRAAQQTRLLAQLADGVARQDLGPCESLQVGDSHGERKELGQ